MSFAFPDNVPALRQPGRAVFVRKLDIRSVGGRIQTPQKTAHSRFEQELFGEHTAERVQTAGDTNTQPQDRR